MPYIYKITNNVNNKIYIGKTMFSVEKRWQEHLKECYRNTEKHRPLYAAMRKYGSDNFFIEEIEECDIDKVNEREKYWIEFYQSFKYGYNATKGGDGKAYIDYDIVRATYQELQSIADTAQQLQIDRHTVSKILDILKIKKLSSAEVVRRQQSIAINQYDLQDNYIQTFPSISSAAIAVGAINSKKDRGAASHISEVCKGKRKTAYGYKWKFAD